MCGLVAWLNAMDGVDFSTLESMTHALAHRGPDDYGFAAIGGGNFRAWKEQSPGARDQSLTVGLGHRRLSILDRSEAGRQPMSSDDGRFWIVYNGEVYNFSELRDALSDLGFDFSTGTDTEVVLKAFEAWGPDCFRRFNGMWAIVIFDTLTGDVTACRDRFGVKPLYFWNRGREWIFASEVKALARNPAVAMEPNEAQLQSFLYGTPNPDNSETFFAGIYAVEPGTALTIHNGKPTVTRYWQPPDAGEADHTDDASCVEHLRWLLEDSVRLRLRSDVRVGTMVSGGMDSTSVISIVRGLLTDESGAGDAVGDKLHGFHAQFPGLPIDERENVSALSLAHDLNVHVVEPLEIDDVSSRYVAVVESMERPFMRSVPLVNTLLMECAKKSGITVVLNGHGSDEVFAGYPDPYVTLAGAELLGRGNLPGALLNALGGAKSGMSGRHVFGAMLRMVFPGVSAMVFPLPVGDPTRGGVLRALANQPGGGKARAGKGDWLSSRLRTDFTRDILPHWLHMEDRTSMSASVEARQPFLDYRLVEFGFKLRNRMKIRRGVTKFILRRAMRERLPRQIVSDQRKQPFAGPDAVWLRAGMSGLIDEYLMTGSPRVAPFVDVSRLRQHVAEFRKHDGQSAGPVLWKILESEIWLRRFFG